MNKTALNIRINRTKQNLTQEQLAAMASITRPTVRNAERINSTKSPTIGTLSKIAKALDLNLSDLHVDQYVPDNLHIWTNAECLHEERKIVKALIACGDHIEGSSEARVLSTTYQNGSLLASSLREAIHAPSVIDLTCVKHIAAISGYQVVTFPWLSDSYALMSFKLRHTVRPFIAVGTTQLATKKETTFNIASELGYLLLDPQMEAQHREIAAIEFARELLLPSHVFRKHWQFFTSQNPCWLDSLPKIVLSLQETFAVDDATIAHCLKSFAPLHASHIDNVFDTNNAQ